MAKKDSISTIVTEDSDFWSPDHPIFAPMQAALTERFDRKLAEIGSELRYESMVHALLGRDLGTELLKNSCLRNT